jgi:hypothetical protein
VKQIMLALAAVTLFVTIAALPSLADGNPMPICTKTGCQKPLPDYASSVSWQEFYAWTANNVATQSCSSDSSGFVWTCSFDSPSGTELLVVWDSSQSCTVEGCTYSSFTVPTGPGYTQYYILGSSSGTSLGSTVNIGCYPILLSQ